MATRTIANAGGNWSATGTWVEGAVPTSADDVVATATSGALTIDAASSCRSIDLTNYVSTLTHAAAMTLSVGDASGGALKFVAGMTYTLGSTTTSAVTFVSTSNNAGTGWSVTTAGKNFGNVTFSGTGGKWVLQGTFNATAATLSFTDGTLDTNSVAINAASFSTFSSNTRTLTLGSSSFTLTGSNGWQSFVTGLTVTANTATATIDNFSGTFSAAGNWNGLSLVFTANVQQAQILGSTLVTLGNVTITGRASGAAYVTPPSGGLTITGNFTVSGNSADNRYRIGNTQGVGTQRTITVNGTNTFTNADFSDINAAGTASWNVSAITGGGGDLGGNTGITFAASVTRYGVVGGSMNSTTVWAATSGGAAGASVPLPHDDIVLDAGSGSVTYTVVRFRTARNFTCTGFTGTLAYSAQTTFFGSFTLASGMTLTGNSSLDLGGRGTHTITMAGKTWPNTIDIVGGPVSTYTLQDAFTVTSILTLHQGTFDTNNQAVSLGGFTGTSPYGSFTRALTLGTSTVTLTSTGAVWTVTATSFTLSASSSTIVIGGTAVLAPKSMALAALTYGTITFTVSTTAGALTLSGGATIGTFNVGSGRSLILTASSTYTITNWNVAGVANGYIVFPAGLSGDKITTPDSVALSLTGDIDLRAKVAPADWTPTTKHSLVAKYGSATTFSYQLQLDTTGKLFLGLSSNGTSFDICSVLSSVATGFTDGTTHWVRATRVSTVVTFYWSDDYDIVAQTGTWTQLGTTAAATAGAMQDNASVVEVGTRSGGTAEVFIGNYYAAEIRSSAGGTVVASYNAAAKTGAATYTDTQSNVWTHTGMYLIGDGHVEIQSTSAGTRGTITKAGGGTVTAAYLAIKDNQANPTSATWYAYPGGVDNGNNLGWTFGPIPPFIARPTVFRSAAPLTRGSVV